LDDDELLKITRVKKETPTNVTGQDALIGMVGLAQISVSQVTFQYDDHLRTNAWIAIHLRVRKKQFITIIDYPIMSYVFT